MITVRIICEKGHSQEIRFDDTFTREYVESWCGLIDGNSPLFVHPPVGTSSVIGKCSWPVDKGYGRTCGKQIKAVIVD